MQLHARDIKGAQRKTLLFAVVLCVLIIGSGIALTDGLLQSAQSDMHATVERTLLERAQGDVSDFTAWSSTLFGHVDALAKTDLLCLFAYEVQKNAKNITKLLRIVKGGPIGDVPPPEELVQLARQFSPMGKVLDTFVQRNEFDSVCLLTVDLKGYLCSARSLPKLNHAQMEGAQIVMERGRRVVLPVWRGKDNRLRVDILQPIFAPAYIEDAKDRVTAVMWVTADITDIVTKISRTRTGNSPQAVRFLQLSQGTLYPFPKETGLEEKALVSWQLSSMGQLPFARRLLPGGESVFLLGLPTPGLPWIIAVDEPVDLLQQEYEEYRATVLFAVFLGGAALMIVICAAWWWLVGQREKAVKSHIDALSEQNRQQQELLENINSHLSDAIVLKDGSGKIHYCNAAFAAFLNQPAEELIGKNAEQLFSSMTNLPVNPHVKSVLETGVGMTFTEVLQLGSSRHTYQVVCSPFKMEEGGKTGVVCVYRDITSLLEAQDRTQHMAYQVIHVLVSAIETVDPYLAGQSMRTAELAQILASFLGLEKVHMNTLRAAANLSQVGMLHIPADLRSKAGRLTSEERKQLQKHVSYARRMLENIDFGFPVQDAIYQMYEAVDGSGYPQGLKGEAICIDARILAVANTFCALMRPRAYRQARSMDEALSILSLDAPQYDAAVVQALHNFLHGPLGKKFVQAISKVE